MAKIKLSNGVVLEYHEFGEGDRYLLCTQNFFLSGNHMELLANPPYNYHTFLVTMRGYGGSDHVFCPKGLDWVALWGNDLLLFADALGIDRFYYTGISHGTLAGWYIAMHRPERLYALAAISGLPLFSAPGQPLPIKLPQWYENGIIGNREKLEKMAWNLWYPTKDPARLQRRTLCHKEHLEILAARSREEFEVVVTNMSACEAQTEEEYYAYIAKIPIPLLILFGMRDNSCSFDKAVQIARCVPGAKLVSFEHFEHGAPDECPELTAQECDMFFRQTDHRIL